MNLCVAAFIYHHACALACLRLPSGHVNLCMSRLHVRVPEWRSACARVHAPVSTHPTWTSSSEHILLVRPRESQPRPSLLPASPRLLAMLRVGYAGGGPLRRAVNSTTVYCLIFFMLMAG